MTKAKTIAKIKTTEKSDNTNHVNKPTGVDTSTNVNLLVGNYSCYKSGDK